MGKNQKKDTEKTIKIPIKKAERQRERDREYVVARTKTLCKSQGQKQSQ